jgi:hypothetical protein
MNTLGKTLWRRWTSKKMCISTLRLERSFYTRGTVQIKAQEKNEDIHVSIGGLRKWRNEESLDLIVEEQKHFLYRH